MSRKSRTKIRMYIQTFYVRTQIFGKNEHLCDLRKKDNLYASSWSIKICLFARDTKNVLFSRELVC
jgi:hypothetical protein